jgi:hypothetical protein
LGETLASKKNKMKTFLRIALVVLTVISHNQTNARPKEYFLLITERSTKAELDSIIQLLALDGITLKLTETKYQGGTLTRITGKFRLDKSRGWYKFSTHTLKKSLIIVITNQQVTIKTSDDAS